MFTAWIADKEARFDKFCSKHVDRDLEKRIRCVVGFEDQYREIENELAEAGVQAHSNRKLMGVMALYGKIPYEYVSEGVCSGCHWISSLTEEEFVAFKEDMLRFITWYDKKLREHGVEEEMVMYKYIDRANKEIKFPDQPTYPVHTLTVKDARCCGIYTWPSIKDTSYYYYR